MKRRNLKPDRGPNYTLEDALREVAEYRENIVAKKRTPERKMEMLWAVVEELKEELKRVNGN